ncbi:MAG TPA: GAF domain-containing sensor histidine kinase [Acidimicrobiia bacterium]|nr:GAF domain-containing sensor histidine kinase [Acidimicrobiia bacterium]
MDTSQSTAEVILAAITEAVASGRSLKDVLTRLAQAAKDISGASYAAIGIPEPEGDAFAAFIHVGMSDELVAEMGPLPRTHGMLDAMLHDPEPVRLPDIKKDRRFRGWWPRAHPPMSSFLGVPIVSEGEVVGAFYLTDKMGAAEFTDEDQAGIALLASHAAAAIEAAGMFEDSRSLAMSEERERLARELHDALNQSLFSLSLTARAAARHIDTDPGRAAEELNEIALLSRQAMTELRAVVDGLRTPDVERDGLVPAIRSLADLLSRVHHIEIEVLADGEPGLEGRAEHEVFRIVQEALTNAVRHSQADNVTVSVADGDGLAVTISDDGQGFEPQARNFRGKRLGLTSMRDRASGLGGRLTIDSAPGRGATVRLEVPA